MKVILSALVLIIVSGCTGSKMLPLNEVPELLIDAPYFQRIMPGQKDGIKSMVLYLPYQESVASYGVDSVYFMGYHEPLKSYESGKAKGYRAKIAMPEAHQEVNSPYELAKNEALVSYIDSNQVKRYFKVKNITEKEPIFMP